MSDQSYMDFLSDSSPPSSGAIPSWGSYQILSFGGTSSNFVLISIDIYEESEPEKFFLNVSTNLSKEI